MTSKIVVVHSTNLSEYKLTKPQKELLKKWREMRDYMLKVNRTPPCVRLTRSQYADLDALVSHQSEGKFRLGDLQYEGVPILSAYE